MSTNDDSFGSVRSKVSVNDNLFGSVKVYKSIMESVGSSNVLINGKDC